jgi:hypothetical protein
MAAMSFPFTDAELEAYLDESLPAPQMASIEAALRGDAALAQHLAELIARRDAGVHSLGAIWRRERLSCPTREELGSFLLGVLEPGLADYIRFHLEQVGCRWCLANYEDLQRQHTGSTPQDQLRRQKYFQSTAGHLRPSGP